ncbi:phosphate regulon transcriptional regulator PhoB [Castellaniella sp.]|uniref:phosphate regulon transcriptional regulator PhoB n=1 Tax=Castellaniella sp. TaxID=1955812 RepID=UPI002AFDD6EB|nr:phosphate regulon transcriptional regulator PhoB [Castellaniella sp.]
MSATILIIEDEPAILELLSVNLTHAGYTVNTAQDTRQAQVQIQSVLPDLILLDWMLPDQPGIRLAQQLRAAPRTRDIPLIMLTARGAEQDKVDGLEAGADDYLTKPFSPRELLARIKSLLRRRAPQLTPDPIQAGELMLDPNARQVFARQQTLTMGPTEFRLLHFLMTHAQRVYSRSQLLDQVWGDHVFVEERTVDVHIRRLRKALSPANQEHTIQTVRGAGYRFSTTHTE